MRINVYISYGYMLMNYASFDPILADLYTHIITTPKIAKATHT